MNQPSRRILCQALLLTVLYGFAQVVAANHKPVSRIAVVFVKPENFTDARRAELKPNADTLLDVIAKFMEEMAEETIPRI